MIRDIEFLEPGIQVSILSERRAFQPYGLQGGEDAQSGLNLWVKQRREADGDLVPANEHGVVPPRVINLGGKATTKFGAGDRIVIHTPGGGGFGTPDPDVDAPAPSRAAPSRHRGSLADWQALQLGA